MVAHAAIPHVIAPRQERSARYLEKVMEAAERVLRRDGMAALTIPAVAVEAQVSVGGIYRRFETKQDLLRALKERHLSRSEAVMSAAMAKAQPNLQAAIHAFLATLIPDRQPMIGHFLEGQQGDQVMEQRGKVANGRLRTAFLQAVAPFRGAVAHPDPDAAIEMAFVIALSVYLSRSRIEARTGAPTAWPALRQELERAMLAYLTWPGTSQAG